MGTLCGSSRMCCASPKPFVNDVTFFVRKMKSEGDFSVINAGEWSSITEDGSYE